MSSQHLPSYFLGKIFSSPNVILGDCQPDCTILLVKVITLKMGSWSIGTWKDAQQQLIIRENVNQNHNEISLHTWQNSYKKKTNNVLVKMWKKENCCTVVRNVIWCGHCGNSMESPPKLKTNHMIQQFYFIWRKSKH